MKSLFDQPLKRIILATGQTIKHRDGIPWLVVELPPEREMAKFQRADDLLAEPIELSRVYMAENCTVVRETP